MSLPKRKSFGPSELGTGYLSALILSYARPLLLTGLGSGFIPIKRNSSLIPQAGCTYLGWWWCCNYFQSGYVRVWTLRRIRPIRKAFPMMYGIFCQRLVVIYFRHIFNKTEISETFSWHNRETNKWLKGAKMWRRIVECGIIQPLKRRLFFDARIPK